MAYDSTTGTMEEHLEDIASPHTQRALRQFHRENDSRSANPASAETLWTNADAAITSRHQEPQQHQQPQQQQTREQCKSAAEQEQVLAAAAFHRSAAALANNVSAFGNSNDDNDDSNGIDDDDTGSNGIDYDDTGSNSTFNCSNSLRKIGVNSAIQRSDIIDRCWKSNYKRLRPSY